MIYKQARRLTQGPYSLAITPLEEIALGFRLRVCIMALNELIHPLICFAFSPAKFLATPTQAFKYTQ